MLLRNFDFATRYFDYETKTELEDTSNPRIYGWYRFINGLLSALIVVDFNIYFLHGEKKILINDSYKALLKRINNTESEFRLMDGCEIFVKFIYQLPDSKLNTSPFEYIDEDDFKWGEFIAKIINDKERQRNFVINLMENH